MTIQLKLTDKNETMEVDFMHLNPRIDRTGVNPIITISLPATAKDDETESQKTAGGAESFDLKMMQDHITITFTLKPEPEKGVPVYGHHRVIEDQANWTNYEKLWKMFKLDTEYKHLYWGDSDHISTKFHVVITRLSTYLNAGQKDLMLDCQVVLQVMNSDDT